MLRSRYDDFPLYHYRIPTPHGEIAHGHALCVRRLRLGAQRTAQTPLAGAAGPAARPGLGYLRHAQGDRGGGSGSEWQDGYR